MAASRRKPSAVEVTDRGVPGIIPPLWAARAGEPEGRGASGKADRPALSREAIVEAALRIVDTEGFDVLSMRRVAQEFSTGAASLYAYVANKDELIDLLLDRVIGECPVAPPDPEHWQELVKKTVRDSYRILVSHRDVAKAFIGRAPFGPNGLANIEAVLALLRSAGLPDHIAAYAGDLLGQYVTSWAIEAAQWDVRNPSGDPEELRAKLNGVADYLSALPPDRFPNLIELAHTMMGGNVNPEFEQDDQDGEKPFDPGEGRFELGLDILVRGLASYLPQ